MPSANLTGLRNVVLSWVAPELLESQPKLLLLKGAMGSGKTTFTTVLAEQLGAPDAASPSFAIHSRYEGPRGTIDHFDLDRLKSAEELESIGFWDLISEASHDSRRFVVIEWASRLDEFGFPVTNAVWKKPFRVWQFEFSGGPSWAVSQRLV
jgi:tRNA threonylcarbamoyladenosine biosynthesis protein TsaE